MEAYSEYRLRPFLSLTLMLYKVSPHHLRRNRRLHIRRALPRSRKRNVPPLDGCYFGADAHYTRLCTNSDLFKPDA
jgi:hypothetical protein